MKMEKASVTAGNWKSGTCSITEVIPLGKGLFRRNRWDGANFAG